MPEKLRTLKNKKGASTRGFRKRASTRTGKAVIKRRRLKGRKKV